MTERVIDVYADLDGTPILVGTAFFHGFGPRLRTTFSYAQGWLQQPRSFALAPNAPLQRMMLETVGIPGFLSDAAPDRWGRHLIFRGAQGTAQMAGRRMGSLDDVDYLLGVDDWSRMGALRISADKGRTFLGIGTDIPKMVRLPQLLEASRRVSAGTDGWEQVKSLLDAGSSSLGGARPKATVSNGNKLLLAKFPSAHDQWDVIAWEAFALEIASRAGLGVPLRQLERIGHSSVLLVRRFDRKGAARVPYISALCALDLKDGTESDYAELGDMLREMSVRPQHNLQELLGRATLNIALHNTDDHLRNHGLVHTGDGWQLSPVFDVNPNPYAEERRALAMFGENGASEIEGLWQLSQVFGISTAEFGRIVRRVVGAFRHWKHVARHLGCSSREIAMFEPVFVERLDALAKHRFVQAGS